ncbi:hypothetical protein [Pyrococcus kukulkanii]|uniref:DUF7982 domain-containing protein n=1 Tax=Pyrococcus kukulkanii TaxID=1609559 RepID=A0A127B7F2_9EURY|nr:hypothetical protein [Pyrococcus kukulkanii]AMM53292.1 hypothetical protein TQ32_01345 [Pyrococcus kukulkanii]
MERALISGLAILGIGAFISTTSVIMGTDTLNIGLAALIIGAVVLAFKSEEYVRRDTLDLVVTSVQESLEKMVKDLGLEGNAVYLPPYENLPEGGVFIPLVKDYRIDLGKLSEDSVFLTEVSSEREMGLLIRPPGGKIVEKFEEHLEGEITSVPEVESVSTAVLKFLELAESVYIEDAGNTFYVYVKPRNIEFCKRRIKNCNQVACPICSSILLGLAKGSGQLLESEKFEIDGERVKITVKKLGGISEWM